MLVFETQNDPFPLRQRCRGAESGLDLLPDRLAQLALLPEGKTAHKIRAKVPAQLDGPLEHFHLLVPAPLGRQVERTRDGGAKL